MYRYGWREYMPEIGRWNGIDQLAESYLSTSTYAYVANNPVLRFDVDGRWFNDDGTIDTSGRTPSFVSGKQYLESFLGVNRNDGSGGASGGGTLWVGDVTPDNGVTLGDLIDAWLNNNSTDYFAGIDFTQFGADDMLDCPKCPKSNKEITPFELGTEWLSGKGPRHRNFTSGDLMTEMLRKHSHVQNTRNIILSKMANGKAFLDGSNSYRLGGVKGVGLYLKDYSTLLTGGLTGNLAVTYLGSYDLKWTASAYWSCYLF